MKHGLRPILLTCWLLAGPAAFAEGDPAFARQLYQRGYPMLSALEWARVAVDSPDPGPQLELGYALWRAGQETEALRLLELLAGDMDLPPAARTHARSLRLVIDLTEARFAAAGEQAEALWLDPEVPASLRDDLRKTIVAAHLVSGDRAAALERLELTRPAEAAIARELAGEPENLKSPRLAGFLSAVVPGAGQAYCGRWQDASIAFLVNAILIGTALEAYDNDQPWLGTTTAVFGAGWYVGNIYSAVNTAHKHNETRRAERVLDWLGRLQIGMGENSLRVGFGMTF